MEIASVLNSLLERHPDLLFRLSCFPYCLPIRSPYKQTFRRQKKWDLEKIDLFYVYGLGRGEHYPLLKGWLKEKKERRLIFLEEDLGAVAALLQPETEALFLDDQVKIIYLSDELSLEEHLGSEIETYPTERVEMDLCLGASASQKRRFAKARLTLFRLSTVAHALRNETLFSHQLLPHLLRNVSRWPTSFLATGLKGKFQNIPAMICGAGPSLADSFETLKQLEDKVLLLAGGSTIAALSNHGITPHLGLVIDPNPEEFDRLKSASAYAMPFVYGLRLQPDVMNTLNGESGYLHTETGGMLEHHFEDKMELREEAIGPEMGMEALSVTTLAIALAVEMGCNPILLNGIDLAYTGMNRYAPGVMPSSAVVLKEIEKRTQASERVLKRKSIGGKVVSTMVKWVMESECIAAYAKHHPDRRFYQVSSGGIGFDAIPHIPLHEVEKQERFVSRDLRALVHAEIHSLPIRCTPLQVEQEKSALLGSLHRLKTLVEEMLQELRSACKHCEIHDAFPSGLMGKMALFELEMEEEKAFEPLFLGLLPAIDSLLKRTGVHGESPSNFLQKQLAKWQHFQERIETNLTHFL